MTKVIDSQKLKDELDEWISYYKKKDAVGVEMMSHGAFKALEHFKRYVERKEFEPTGEELEKEFI